MADISVISFTYPIAPIVIIFGVLNARLTTLKINPLELQHMLVERQVVFLYIKT